MKGLASHLLPVALHMSLLQVNVAVCDLARVACVWVRRSGARSSTRGGNTGHDGKRGTVGQQVQKGFYSDEGSSSNLGR